MKELINSERKEKLIEVPPVVIKIGGNSLVQENTVLEDIVRLHKDGTPLIIVHGGGPAIDKALKTKDINPRRKNGIRITDRRTLETVIEVTDNINKFITIFLLGNGVNAVGTDSKNRKLLKAVKANYDLGFVGQISQVDKASIENLLSQGQVPVISPIILSEEKNSEFLNVNSDTVAGRIAANFSGSRLLIISDVTGIMMGKKVAETLDENTYQRCKETGVIRAGMIPKVEACFDALRHGSSPRIIFGGAPHSILIALENPNFGTSFEKE